MAVSRNFKLEASFDPSGDQGDAISQLVAGFKNGNTKQTLLGVTGSGKTFTMANIIKEINRPTMILSHNKTLAAQLYGEMREFFPNNAVEYFVSYYDYYQPEAYVRSTDTYIEKDAKVNEQIDQMRLSATKALMERSDAIVVCTVSAIYGLGEPENYLRMIIHLEKGETINRSELFKRLATLQYTRNDIAMSRATFRVKGDVIDIFPAESDTLAIRLEMFDDEIESITEFDPLTGEKGDKLDRVTIFPSSHYITPRDVLLKAMDEIRDDLNIRCNEFLAAGKLLEEQRIRERTQYDLEMINEVGYCSGIENYSRYLTGRKPGEAPPCLFDYLPKDGLLIIDESHVTVPQIGAMYLGDRSRKESLIEFGFRLPSALDNRPLKFEEFEKLQPKTIYVSATPAEYEIEHSQLVAEQIIRPTGLLDPIIEVRPASTQLQDVMEEIKKRSDKKERTLVTTLTKAMAEQLSEYLLSNGIRAKYMHSDIDTVERMNIIHSLRMGEFDALVGINLLREGLDIPEVSLVAILDADQKGFLRSTRSLIQTIGRAARNVNGMAIFYADTITDAMQTTIDETSRRRKIQDDYNKKHGIVPTQINKKIVDVMEMALQQTAEYRVPVEQRDRPTARSVWEDARGINTAPSGNLKRAQVGESFMTEALDMVGTGATGAVSRINVAKAKANDKKDFIEVITHGGYRQTKLPSPQEITKKIAEIQNKMVELARELKFEEAAVLRDEMKSLEKLLLLMPGRDDPDDSDSANNANNAKEGKTTEVKAPAGQSSRPQKRSARKQTSKKASKTP